MRCAVCVLFFFTQAAGYPPTAAWTGHSVGRASHGDLGIRMHASWFCFSEVRGMKFAQQPASALPDSSQAQSYTATKLCSEIGWHGCRQVAQLSFKKVGKNMRLPNLVCESHLLVSRTSALQTHNFANHCSQSPPSLFVTWSLYHTLIYLVYSYVT